MNEKYNEQELELTIIQMLEEKNYDYVGFNDSWIIDRKLDSFIIDNDLTEALAKINPNIKSVLFDEVIKKVKHIDAISFIDKNKLFHKYLIDGVAVEDFHSHSNPLIKIIDFENPKNNIFKVVNQVKFNEGKSTRIPDILIYVNGIPLIIFELKSIENREDSTIENAYQQLGGSSTNNGYRYDIPTLFNYNAFCVISDGVNNRIGTITSDFERYSEWKSVNGEVGYSNNSVSKLDTLIDGVFEQEKLLDIIKNNLFFIEKDKENPIKVLSQYHQYFGVLKSYDSILSNKKPTGDGKAGIIWHTQGSGKSFSMLMLVYRLIQEKSLQNPTVIVLTDRNDLDDQLFTTFSSAKGYLRVEPIKVTSRQDLLDKVSKVKESGIYFTTLQKIDKENIVPNNRDNIIIISDEAHRSHYGVEESISYKKNSDSVLEMQAKYGYEKYIRDAFPNATFIGFTGTPVQTKDKDTTAIFGDILDVYDMTQSIEDGSTVKLFYESRLAKVWLDENKLKEIDKYYESLTSDGVTDELIDMSKSQMSKMEVLVGDRNRLELLGRDILDHYENRKGILNDKAMIVCMSRKIAFDLYNIMLELRPKYKDMIQLIITSSNKDDNDMRDAIKDKMHRDKIANDFKNKKGNTKIVIVVDMWLTGFDVADLDVMYVDKPMKGHNLMQAIARVNRVYSGKESGLIVDYIGISKALDEALDTYTNRDKEINLKDIRETATSLIAEKLSVLDEWFHHVDTSGFESERQLDKFRSIQNGADFVLEDEKRKKEFLNISKILKSAYIIALGVLSEKAKSRINYYLAVRHFIQKIEYSKNPISLTKINERVSELLAEAICGDEIKVLTKVNAEDDSSVWDLLREDKIQELRNSNPPHVFIKLLEKLLTQAIKEYKKYNLFKSQEYSEKLRKLLMRYYDRPTLDLEEDPNVEWTIVGLMAFSQEMVKDEGKAESNNLKGRERAFYDALTSDSKATALMGDETLRLIATKLKDIVEEYATVDWSKKKTTQAEMRSQIKRLLDAYGYPPEYNEVATVRVISQAEYMM